MSKTEDELELRYLRAWRHAMGPPKVTQKKLAKCMGVTQGFISQVERGGNTMSLANASRAAKCLGIKLEDLLRDPNDPRARARDAIKESLSDDRKVEAIKGIQKLTGDALDTVASLIRALLKATNGTSPDEGQNDVREPSRHLDRDENGQ